MSESKKNFAEDRLLTGRQAAEALAVSLRTLRALVQRGELGVVRIGMSVRIDPADLRQLIERRKQCVADLREAARRKGLHLTTAAALEFSAPSASGGNDPVAES